MTTQTPEATTQTTSRGKAAETEAAKVATEYVILRAKADEEGTWEVLPDKVTATNKDAALRKGTEKQLEGGDFKAVAVSAWRGGKRMKKEQVTNTVYEDLED